MPIALAVSLFALQAIGATAAAPLPEATPQRAETAAVAPIAAPARAAIPARLAPAAALSRDEAIRQAVRATLAAEDAKAARKYDTDTIRADKYTAFAAAFAEARVPDCLHSDGLKRQPTNIGPIQIVGQYALPFVLIAKLRGKCN